MQSYTVRVRAIDYRGSVCDGPGIRTVVFVQGCSRHCPHCHNPETWDPTDGYTVDAILLASDIIRNSQVKRITISGGEPLDQADAIAALVAEMKEACFDIALYTSYTAEEVPQSILSNIDYLKTGEYIEDLRTTTSPYYGSKNQKFWKVLRTTSGRIELEEWRHG